MKKKGKHMENQKANLQNWKKTEAKEMVKKRNVKKGKSWEQHGLVPLHFSRQKAKNKIKANKKQIEKGKINANGPVHFFPFLTFLFSPWFFIYLLLCFLDFADVLFVSFCFALGLVFFSSLLILRISYGLVKIILCSPKAVGISPIVTTVVL